MTIGDHCNKKKYSYSSNKVFFSLFHRKKLNFAGLEEMEKGYWVPNGLYQIVAHSTMRTYEVNLEFRFVEGIFLKRKSRQIRFVFSEMILFTSYMRNMF